MRALLERDLLAQVVDARQLRDAVEVAVLAEQAFAQLHVLAQAELLTPPADQARGQQPHAGTGMQSQSDGSAVILGPHQKLAGLHQERASKQCMHNWIARV